MAKAKSRRGEITNKILEILLDLGDMVPQPFETPYAWIRRSGSLQRATYQQALYRLRNRGIIEITKKKNKKFLRLTEKGQIRALLAGAKTSTPARWDGKWRLVMFDIPEQFHNQRKLIRQILKKQGFIKLQASVFINPQPINRAAVEYLKRSKLIDFIRFARVDELDDERELLRHFRLKR